MNRLIHSLTLLIKTVVVTTVLFIGSHSVILAQAQQTHTVQSGETLFSIAKKFDVSVEQLREWNNLSGNNLEVGRSLIVSQGSSASSGDAITHTVQPQETLFSISKQYRVSISELKQWNNLSSNNLNVGQKLTIYPPDENAASQSDTSQNLVVNTTTKANTYYTVKSGDTLYQIGQQFGMSLDELKTLNDLTSNTIRVGQRLTVRKPTQAAPSVAQSASESTPQGAFVMHKVERGSSLQDILQKYEMTEPEFNALNPDVSSPLRSGQEVTVLLPPSRNYKNPYTVQSSLKDLGKTVVTAYDSSQKGTTTTSGELYNPNELTAAHSNIALGNVIFIQNPRNKKGIYVRINDRFSGNGLKLSRAALQSLDLSGSGNATVNMYQDQ